MMMHVYNTVPTLRSEHKIKLYFFGTTQMKAIEQYFHVVLFNTLYKVVLTFKSVGETLVCDHSNDSYWAVLSCGTVYNANQGGFHL